MFRSGKKFKKVKEVSLESLGLPPASMDPMKTIEMEGAMFRGMVNTDIKRTPFIRFFFHIS